MPIEIPGRVKPGDVSSGAWASAVRDSFIELQPSSDGDVVKVSDEDNVSRPPLTFIDLLVANYSKVGRDRPRHFALLNMLPPRSSGPGWGTISTSSGDIVGLGMQVHEVGANISNTDYWSFTFGADGEMGGFVGPWYDAIQRPSMVCKCLPMINSTEGVTFIGFGTNASFGIGPTDMIAFVVLKNGNTFTRTRRDGAMEENFVGANFDKYQILMPDAETVEFYADSNLVAIHRNNIPTVPIRLRVGTYISVHGGTSSVFRCHQLASWSYEVG